MVFLSQAALSPLREFHRLAEALAKLRDPYLPGFPGGTVSKFNSADRRTLRGTYGTTNSQRYPVLWYYKWRVKFIVVISVSFNWASRLSRHFFKTWSIWVFHFKLSFICRPKKVHVFTCEISLLLICRCRWGTCLGALWNSIFFVLLMFNDNLFDTNQLLTLLSSVLITLSL